MSERIRRVTHRNEAGFTLIELLVVITILGILAGIVVFSVGGVTTKGQTAACQTDTVTIQTAEEAYYAQNGHYAASIAELVSGGFLSSPGSTWHSVTTTGPSGDSGFLNYAITEATTTCGHAGDYVGQALSDT